MSKCIGSPAQELAEQYLAGELPESEAESFENHYFGCNLCHEHLLALQDLRDGLAREPIAIVAPAPRQSLRGRILAFPIPMAVLASLAAASLVGAILVGVQRSSPVFHSRQSLTASVNPQPNVPHAGQPGSSSQGPAPANVGTAVQAPELTLELASLADLHLPGYQQPQLRGEEAANSDHAQFSSGMEAYAQGDCQRALKALVQVPTTADNGVAAKLYSGLCQLKGRKPEAAQASFAAVVAAGDTPQLETAEYFLAQTRLLRGDGQGARNWLTRTIALRGDYEPRARKQAALLPR